ncbi:phosphonate C-P lyase system protein PhnH, partial [Pseudomonas aeruginosa]|uniref:phosphonate C-P lyase system protein PhnH n=1 Tax=Pseudomonas aeruginosa TaxID=287 RepID=UPI003CC53337
FLFIRDSADAGVVPNLDRARALAALHPPSYALCLSFLDSDTPLWLAPGLDSPTLRTNLAFHCGCPIVAEREQALFALL